MALNQFCGCFAMINFTATIFKESGSTLSPNISSIVVGGIQIIGSIFPTLLVDRLGRKMMMVISAFGTSMGLTVLGVYMLVKSQGFNVEAFNWIPLVAFSFTIFIGEWMFVERLMFGKSRK
jgi:SP family facilitated glucose transporter-like MFS transporter 8